MGKQSRLRQRRKAMAKLSQYKSNDNTSYKEENEESGYMVADRQYFIDHPHAFFYTRPPFPEEHKEFPKQQGYKIVAIRVFSTADGVRMRDPIFSKL